MSDPLWWAEHWPGLLAAVTMMAVVWGAVRLAVRIAPAVRRIGHLVDDLIGEPARPGQPARPGVMERLRDLDARTTELRPNGGHSIKDAVTRIDQRVEHLDQRLDAVERAVVPDRPRPRPRPRKADS